MFFTSNNFKSQPSESEVFILFGFSTVRLVPAGHVNTAVLPDSNKHIRDGDVGLGRQAAVQEVRVGFPDVLRKVLLRVTSVTLGRSNFRRSSCQLCLR